MTSGEQNGGSLTRQAFLEPRRMGDGGGGQLFAEGGAGDEELLTRCSASKTVVVYQSKGS